MSYQVIARKYRPQRFADVVGQDHVTQTLANAISQKRIAHAYLFVGPRGTGKTTMARIFAKCLNASNGPTIDYVEDDPRCREITDGRSLDVFEIDGASNRGIEEVRELRETVKYTPATSRFKIYIIDEVHMLTKEAFNALLKTLEEPPEHVKFMFATTEVDKVLPTILSRCQRFDLRRIPIPLIVGHLAKIAALEGVRIDEGALYAIARGAEGGMRDAESTLDQLISFCGSEIKEDDVLAMFGLASRSQINALAKAIAGADLAEAFRLLDSLAKGGKDLARLLGELQNYFRNILVFQVAKGDRSLLEVSESEATALTEASQMLDFTGITQVLEVLAQADGRLREASSKRIFLEITLYRAIQARKAIGIDAVLNRLQQLREESPVQSSQDRPASVVPSRSSTPDKPSDLVSKSPTSPTFRSTGPIPVSDASLGIQTPPSPVPQSVTPPTPGSDRKAFPSKQSAQPTQDLGSLWNTLIDQIGKASPLAKTYLVEAFPISLTATTLTLGLDPEFADHLSLMDNPKSKALIQTKLGEEGLSHIQVKFVIADRPQGSPRVQVAQSEQSLGEGSGMASGTVRRPAPEKSRTPVPSPEKSVPAKPLALSKSDFRDDPLIREALELFKGQIVEVR